ncbi:MAG: DUF2239 family protein [Myxococcota bacterium]|jgi:hypothetical protein|nr:DUF2239 family protein [Myxococcota bacterium]
MNEANPERRETYTAFVGSRRIASGELQDLLSIVVQSTSDEQRQSLIIFQDCSGQTIDFDLRGNVEEVLARLPEHPHLRAKASPGRPKLGVVSREVSLLPRHWAWLESQPQGLSASLRRLIDEARKRDEGSAQSSAARDAAAKVMWTLCGNLPNFEEASRAIYAQELEKMRSLMEHWPSDIRSYLESLLHVQ